MLSIPHIRARQASVAWLAERAEEHLRLMAAGAVLLPAAVAHDFDTRHRDNFELVAVDGPLRPAGSAVRAGVRFAADVRADRRGPDRTLKLSSKRLNAV